MSHPRRNDFLIPTLAVIFDTLAIEFSFVFSYWLRFRTDTLSFLPLSGDTPSFASYLYGSFFIVPVWLLMFKSRGMYGARRNMALSDDFFSIVKLATLGMLVVMSAAFFYRAFSYSRIVFGLVWGTSIIALCAGRYALHEIEKALYRSGRELRNAVIIGNDQTADLIHRTFHNHPLLGYRFVGYLADSPASGGKNSSSIQQLTYLGDVSSASRIMTTEHVELALIALDHSEYPQIYRLLRECEGVNVEFMMVPDLLEIMGGGARMKEIEGIPFIHIKGVPMTTWGRIIKRIFDFTLSGILLVLCSPFFLIIGLLIKVDSPGGVFFRQDRVGLDGRKFTMLKFRSMKRGAEEYDKEAALGLPNDARLTSFGRFLRKASLDELPQLVNVLRGDMSLVGPRPERPFFVEQFKNLVPKYLDRHRAKTGMTGWAQVNGLRGNTSLEERIKYDVYYIENWSLWFDIKIILKTFGALLPQRNR